MVDQRDKDIDSELWNFVKQSTKKIISQKTIIKKNTVSDNKSSVPGINKVPILGKMFQYKNKADTLNELLVFIAPRIL